MLVLYTCNSTVISIIPNLNQCCDVTKTLAYKVLSLFVMVLIPGKGKLEERTLPHMVSNPIYEPNGPIYESIDDAPWKTSSIEVRKLTDSNKDTRYDKLSLQSLQPTALGSDPKQMDIGTQFTHSNSGPQMADDCYMLMNPASSLFHPNTHIPTVLPPSGDEYVRVIASSVLDN